MLIKDKIYGKLEIKEPVLLELLKSPSILRLKNISQFGVPDRYYHLKNYSRYEHSVGVMILLRKLGATLEEQVAGLLHDVSVLAFSHVTDWVFANGREGVEDYHNSIHEVFVKKTEIPKILEKFGFDLNRLLNEENFSLLERKIPDLCADRVDYALREFKHWLNPAILDVCIKGLVNYNGEIVFANQRAAMNFSVNFLELQTNHWGGYQAMARYYLFSEVLKIALDKKIILEKDFWRDEPFVLGRLEKTKDKTVGKLLRMLKDKKLNINNKSGRRIVKKFRHVDPKIIFNGKLVRLSKLSPKFKKILEKHRRINQKGLVI